ncbi:uncharacterized protein Z520_07916 [Fonsecaea multimorphosa CBS 102226]|uniref:SET domain-containing protein n=1 Tax=Fonsecaea multimorphosa CBS 102226 TaxID=1442371 RepID=A0A0D2KHH9_9EURO|nr:uncharacterized protein Z520_07916 [Fonsecaea multimorphosa CBS 102226]KIX96138.1 hypothetical protein Z520_07916 [Fonsecaea multimorphosa CBS 102226]OAL22278.1 hypothetical protein AYO22_07322 [Fonsecaea multimorphosa]
MRQVSLPLEDLHVWAHFNNVQLFEISIEPHIIREDGNDKGGGLLAKGEHGPGKPLVAVPHDLLLSKERVEQYAKADQSLQALLEAAAPLVQIPRTAVLLFLVYQMTINNPSSRGRGLGLNNPFAGYVKMLPHAIPLPTFYTPEERELLIGTSLSEALDQKLISLEREFDSLKAATAKISWCQEIWWSEGPDCLTIEDWKLADAMYRSRALELPHGVGVGMVPVIDMANHASDNHYNARFEVDEDSGSVLLVVRDDRVVHRGDEITIMYGCGGACEMIFSYGFLDEHASSAREIFLNLSIPSDDPLRLAKIRCAQEAPGVRIYVDDSDQVRWESTFVWWACINEEDGLDFRVEQTIYGDTELQALWKDNALPADTILQSILLADRLRDIFVLRAVVTIQTRIEEQGSRLAESEEEYNNTVRSDQVRDSVYGAVGNLRRLELELLTRAYETLEREKTQLLESAIVRDYLLQGQSGTESPDGTPDDFS